MADDATLKIGIEGNAQGADTLAAGLSKIQTGLKGVENQAAQTNAATNNDAGFKARIENFEAELAAQRKAAEERRAIREEEAAAEAAVNPAGQGRFQPGVIQDMIGALSLFRERLSMIETGWNQLKEASEQAAAGTGGFANVTVARMKNVSVAIDDLKGGFSNFLGRLLDPENTAGKFAESLNKNLDSIGAAADTVAGRVKRISDELTDATRLAAEANRLTEEVASNEERRLNLFKRQQVAAIDPNASAEQQASQRAAIEVRYLEELGKIKDEKARQQAKAEEDVAKEKLRAISELEKLVSIDRAAREVAESGARSAITEKDREKNQKAAEAARADEQAKAEQIKRLRTEAEAAEAKANEIRTNRSRAAGTEAEERTTVQAEQSVVIAKAREADRAKAEQEAAKAKAEQERAAKEAAKADALAQKGNPSLPGDAFGLVQSLGGGLAAGQKGTAAAEALRSALQGLNDGADKAEMASVIEAVKALGGTLRSQNYKREFEALRRELEALKASVEQDRS